MTRRHIIHRGAHLPHPKPAEKSKSVVLQVSIPEAGDPPAPVFSMTDKDRLERAERLGLSVCEVQAARDVVERLEAMNLGVPVATQPQLPSGHFILCCATRDMEPHIEVYRLEGVTK